LLDNVVAELIIDEDIQVLDNHLYNLCLDRFGANFQTLLDHAAAMLVFDHGAKVSEHILIDVVLKVIIAQDGQADLNHMVPMDVGG